MRPLFEIIPNTRRSQISHVRAQWLLAVQVSYMFKRILQAYEPEESFIFTHR